MPTKLHSGFQFKIFTNLIRALFPNWNFFDRIAYGFELEFKVKDSNKWEPVIFHQKRRVFNFFINPEVNQALAQVNILEHFAKDIQELQSLNPLIHSKDVQKLTTFKMIKSLLAIKMHEYEPTTSFVQFKIIASNPNKKIDLYISDWISVNIE